MRDKYRCKLLSRMIRHKHVRNVKKGGGGGPLYNQLPLGEDKGTI